VKVFQGCSFNLFSEDDLPVFRKLLETLYPPLKGHKLGDYNFICDLFYELRDNVYLRDGWEIECLTDDTISVGKWIEIDVPILPGMEILTRRGLWVENFVTDIKSGCRTPIPPQ
jgi:hypothetical protein